MKTKKKKKKSSKRSILANSSFAPLNDSNTYYISLTPKKKGITAAAARDCEYVSARLKKNRWYIYKSDAIHDLARSGKVQQP
jgi:hypothetical protein